MPRGCKASPMPSRPKAAVHTRSSRLLGRRWRTFRRYGRSEARDRRRSPSRRPWPSRSEPWARHERATIMPRVSGDHPTYVPPPPAWAHAHPLMDRASRPCALHRWAESQDTPDQARDIAPEKEDIAPGEGAPRDAVGGSSAGGAMQCAAGPAQGRRGAGREAAEARSLDADASPFDAEARSSDRTMGTVPGDDDRRRARRGTSSHGTVGLVGGDGRRRRAGRRGRSRRTAWLVARDGGRRRR